MARHADAREPGQARIGITALSEGVCCYCARMEDGNARFYTSRNSCGSAAFMKYQPALMLRKAYC